MIAGGIGPVVRKVAEEQHADLVVIGRGVMHETFGRLRSKSYEIIRQSPCPVLVARPLRPKVYGSHLVDSVNAEILSNKLHG